MDVVDVVVDVVVVWMRRSRQDAQAVLLLFPSSLGGRRWVRNRGIEHVVSGWMQDSWLGPVVRWEVRPEADCANAIDPRGYQYELHN